MENQKLPNATAVLVLGILSLIFCWCYGIPGIILSIIALVLASKDLNLYKANPQNYSNYGTLNAGRIIAIIAIVLNILMIVYFIWIINYIGWENISNPEKLQEMMKQMQNQ